MSIETILIVYFLGAYLLLSTMVIKEDRKGREIDWIIILFVSIFYVPFGIFVISYDIFKFFKSKRNRWKQ